jgi:hypothetical protein
MSKRIYTVALSIVFFASSACKKSGCTDPAALNYNHSARYNDGSCKYFSDQFLGTYTSFDSTYYFVYDSAKQQDSVTLKTYRSNGSFMISRYKSNEVSLTNLLNYGTYYGLSIDSTQFSLLNIPYEGFILNGHFKLINDTFYYNAFLGPDTTSNQRCFGFGVKQH